MQNGTGGEPRCSAQLAPYTVGLMRLLTIYATVQHATVDRRAARWRRLKHGSHCSVCALWRVNTSPECCTCYVHHGAAAHMWGLKNTISHSLFRRGASGEPTIGDEDSSIGGGGARAAVLDALPDPAQRREGVRRPEPLCTAAYRCASRPRSARAATLGRVQFSLSVWRSLIYACWEVSPPFPAAV